MHAGTLTTTLIIRSDFRNNRASALIVNIVQVEGGLPVVDAVVRRIAEFPARYPPTAAVLQFVELVRF
jgi:hypothetical protein